MNRLVSCAAAALLVALAFAGCSKSQSAQVRKVLSINAIAFNDSVAAGDTLFLKVQYTFGSSCEQVAHFEFTVVQGAPTPTYQVVPVALYPASEACTGINGADVATLRVTDLGAGPRTFQVLGANGTLIANVIAGADTHFVADTGIAFRVLAQDVGTGAAVPGAHVQIRNLIDGSTLSEGDADGAGLYAYSQPCGADVQYVVSVSAAGRTANLVMRTPAARCRIPEFVVIRV
ncbi:MAG: hypothetical protein ABI960_03120 [Candidatus Eisenbacteria bacterium]